jgi:hypothetical protein
MSKGILWLKRQPLFPKGHLCFQKGNFYFENASNFIEIAVGFPPEDFKKATFVFERQPWFG